MSENLGMFRSPQQDLFNGNVFDNGNLPVIEMVSAWKSNQSHRNRVCDECIYHLKCPYGGTRYCNARDSPRHGGK